MDATVPLRHLKSVLHQGVGRYVPQLQRLTFQFSKTRVCDKGVRDFLERKSESFCKKHPHVVLYVLPTDAPKSRIIAEYLNGNNLQIDPKNLNLKQVEYWVEMFHSKSGQRDFKLTSFHHTEMPSIQGQWNPMTYKDTRILGNRFAKVKNPETGEYKIRVESASGGVPEEELCVSDVPATNGLFTRVGAW